METDVREGKLVCGNCGHEYLVKEGIANFLLPAGVGEFDPFFFFFKNTLNWKFL